MDGEPVSVKSVSVKEQTGRDGDESRVIRSHVGVKDDEQGQIGGSDVECQGARNAAVEVREHADLSEEADLEENDQGDCEDVAECECKPEEYGKAGLS